MKTTKTFYLGAALAAFVLGTFAVMYPSSSGAQELRLRGDLVAGDGVASGSGKFERRGLSCLSPNGTRCKFSVEVEDFSTDGNFNVFAGSFNMGQISVASGVGDLNLDTDLGATIFNLTSPTTVQVRDGTTVLVSGNIVTKP